MRHATASDSGAAISPAGGRRRSTTLLCFLPSRGRRPVRRRPGGAPRR
ncbi:MAG: hypothetical protein M0C28_23145 [Candidatus Moduliflexus flocculans]|nr:hypothetical protein [Candidatus Moduliflexus flocculans]